MKERAKIGIERPSELSDDDEDGASIRPSTLPPLFSLGQGKGNGPRGDSFDCLGAIGRRSSNGWLSSSRPHPPPPPLASNPLVEDAPKFRRGSAQHHVTGRVPDRYVLIT